LSESGVEGVKNQYVSLLIKNVLWVLEDLRTKDYSQALDDVYWLVAAVDVTKESSVKKIAEVEAAVEEAQRNAGQVQGNDAYSTFKLQNKELNVEARKKVRNALKILMLVLHDEGFLAEAHGLFWNPSQGLKSGKEDHKSFDSRIPAPV